MEAEQTKMALATYDELRDCAYYFLIKELVTKDQFSSIVDYLNEQERQAKIAYQASQATTVWRKT